MNGDGFDGHLKDTRSPLAKALGERGVPTLVVDLFDDTDHPLAGIPMALRSLSESDRVKAEAASLRFLRDECRMDEEYLYGTPDGAAARQLQSKVYMLAAALCEPAPPHAPLVKDADELRRLLDAPTLQQLFEAWLDWLLERNPISRARSVEEVEAVLVALGKGTIPSSRLSSFDSSTLRSALRSLAVQRERLTNSSSSPSPSSTEPAETPPSDD